jgi:hypothetical protein
MKSFFAFNNILSVSTVFSTPYLFLDTAATSTHKFEVDKNNERPDWMTDLKH